MDRSDRNTILNRFLDVEDRKGHRNAGVERSFGEIHSGTDTATISEAHLSRILLSFLTRRGNVALRVESERIRISFGVMEHAPTSTKTGKERNFSEKVLAVLTRGLQG